MKKQHSKWEECVSMKEVKALVGLKHPNIITLNEMILENSELYLIFEHVGQNLYEYSQKQANNLSEMKIRNIIYQILQGLAYMHRQNYFHRDMKPENILINGDFVKIADFG
jgi:protein kinase